MKPVPLPKLIATITTALEPRSEILEAYLFGSRARRSQDSIADVDVAVYLDPAAPAPHGFGYEAELSATLGTAVPGSTVDILVLNHAPPLLYHRVLRDGVRLLARRLQETTTREGEALSRYCDYVPQLRKIAAAQDARIARGRFGR
ncbi:MAG TPA: nucleotidyltransferase domain-containing protein [Candidatus Eisenbacteria bacterium]|jgi:hypothetical protein